MQIHILASGSKGNAALIELGGTCLLIDAGISARRVETGLAGLGVKAGDLDGILVTHEHRDHVQGLEVLARRHELPVFARSAAWEGIPGATRLPGHLRHDFEDEFPLGKILVQPFSTSHDAADPVGFCFHHRGEKHVLATDTGMATPEVLEALAHARTIILESNHDNDMLTRGPYPSFLKHRIRSHLGHLSNLEAALALARGPRPSGQRVFLAHLSQQNNSPQLAESTVRNLLLNRGCEVGREVVLQLTYQDRPVSFTD